MHLPQFAAKDPHKQVKVAIFTFYCNCTGNVEKLVRPPPRLNSSHGSKVTTLEQDTFLTTFHQKRKKLNPQAEKKERKGTHGQPNNTRFTIIMYLLLSLNHLYLAYMG